MSSIYNLDLYQLNRLYSLDPILSSDWQSTLSDILPTLDAESQDIINEQILRSRGISYDKSSKEFVVQKPKTLSEVYRSLPTNNRQLLKAIENLQNIYLSDSTTTQPHNHTTTQHRNKSIR